MRRVWASPIESAASLPDNLRQTLTVTGIDTVQWIDVEHGTGEVISATTLRGLLVKHLGAALGSQIFHEIKLVDDDIYSWKARGPKILRRILDFPNQFSGAIGTSGPPALVGLQEYVQPQRSPRTASTLPAEVCLILTSMMLYVRTNVLIVATRRALVFGCALLWL
jgi:hypothetical protein